MMKSKMEEISLTAHLFDILAKVSIFYVNRLFFVKYLLNKKYKRYFFITGVFVLVVSAITLFGLSKVLNVNLHEQTVLNLNNISFTESYKIFVSLFSNFLVLGVSSAISFFEKIDNNEKKIQQIERTQITAELAMLKNQIHPHFFFNTLNNIHFLVETDVKKAQDSIVELSKLMRYLLYETTDYFVDFKKELDFTKNYISLMEMRMSENLKLNFVFPDVQTQKTIVPPLIFITIIENSFKHCNILEKGAFINCKIEIDDNKISIKTVNSIKNNSTKTTYNLGLNNIRQRLNLLYPSNHILEIEERADEFILELIMNTQNKMKNEIAMYNS